MKLISKVDAYQGPISAGSAVIFSDDFASVLDPQKWVHWGDSGSVVDGKLVFPIGRSGGVTSVDTFPAGSQMTADITISELSNFGSSEGNGHYWIGLFMFQYGAPTGIALNVIINYVDDAVVNVVLNDNAQSFFTTIPLNLLQIDGSTVVIPQFSAVSKPDGLHMYVNGTQIQLITTPGYAPTDGTLVLYNDGYNGVTVSYDNVVVSGPASAWEDLKVSSLPGVDVIRGLVTAVDIDSKGHGHESDIIPAGTNFAILVLTKGTNAQGHQIDGFDSLRDLGDHHSKVWDKIDDKLGGLIFYGALTEDAKKQFKALMKGYDQQYS